MPDDVNDTMDEFIKLVNKASDERLNLMLHNGSYAHARILFNKILPHADNTISLISKECSDSFYGQDTVINPFLDFINKTKGQGKIRVIFENDISNEKIKGNLFVKKLLSCYKNLEHQDSLEVYVLKNNDGIRINGNLSHMLLVDKEGPYRFETHLDRVKKDNDELQNTPTDAVANFGDTQNSRNVWKFFEKQRVHNATKVSLI